MDVDIDNGRGRDKRVRIKETHKMTHVMVTINANHWKEKGVKRTR